MKWRRRTQVVDERIRNGKDHAMKEVTDKNFGVMIAFWLPGFLLLWGLSYSSPEIAAWLAKSSAADAPTVGSFLYATLASLAFGMMVSAVRWLIVDHLLHHITGPARPTFDFGKLKDKDAFAAFQGVVENHYRYYQYYSNTFIAIVVAFVTYIFVGSQRPSISIWVAVIVVSLTLLLAGRDCLKNYYERVVEITK
jgi:hypothetical protein